MPTRPAPRTTHGAAPMVSGTPARGVTMYMQLASELRARIQAQEWRLGEQLPPIDQLATTFGVAKVTVRHAIQLLVQENMVTSSRGRGTFVSGQPAGPDTRLRSVINDPMADSTGFRIDILGRRRQVALPDELRGAGMAASDYVQVDKRHIHGGEPFCTMSLFVDAAVYRLFPRRSDTQRKINGLLLEYAAARLDRFQTSITIVPASLEVAQRLGCPFASPAARIVRRTLDARGVVVYAGLFWYRGDRFVLDFEVPAASMQGRPDWLTPDPAPAASGI